MKRPTSGICRIANSPSVMSAMSKLVPPMSVHTMFRAPPSEPFVRSAR